jgi:hypothetical protein
MDISVAIRLWPKIKVRVQMKLQRCRMWGQVKTIRHMLFFKWNGDRIDYRNNTAILQSNDTHVANMTPESLQLPNSQVALGISVHAPSSGFLIVSPPSGRRNLSNLGITGRPRARWGVWINTLESIRITDNLPHSNI